MERVGFTHTWWFHEGMTLMTLMTWYSLTHRWEKDIASSWQWYFSPHCHGGTFSDLSVWVLVQQFTLLPGHVYETYGTWYKGPLEAQGWGTKTSCGNSREKEEDVVKERCVGNLEIQTGEQVLWCWYMATMSYGGIETRHTRHNCFQINTMWFAVPAPTNNTLLKEARGTWTSRSWLSGNKCNRTESCVLWHLVSFEARFLICKTRGANSSSKKRSPNLRNSSQKERQKKQFTLSKNIETTYTQTNVANSSTVAHPTEGGMPWC